MSDLEERIRRRAYQIWQEEGCPPGQEERHWEMARQLVAIEDSKGEALEPNPLTHPGYAREPVEPIEAVENAGEFPTLTDQGEEQAAPRRRRARSPAPLPLSSEGSQKGRRSKS